MNQRPDRSFFHQSLAAADPEVARAVNAEADRQESGLELIASENFVSAAILEAAGSVLTNKYAEGYPGKRYYGGCEHVDVIESLAITRAVALFGAEHANVQPHSGAQANMTVLLAMLSPGDTILGMNLAHGGHLTHGHPLNFSGKYFDIVPYGVRQDDERIDYDEVARLAAARKPKLVIAGASAYPRVIDFARLRAIADDAGALLMVDMAHIAGLVATGLHPNPVPHADFVTTTTHKTLRGPRGGLILCREVHAKAIDRALFPGVQGGPLMHVIAGKAVCFKQAADPAFVDYQRDVVANARALAEALVAGGYRVVSGGTDTHLVLLDVFSKGITGKVAEAALGRAAITVNKNAIPFDTNPPMVASGIRLGTPAVTTRGFGPGEMKAVAGLISRVLAAPGDAAVAAAVKAQVEQLCQTFPLYPSRLGHDVARAFADDGALARALAQFEPRPGQRRMAAAVATVLDDGGVLLAEAGTGTGKTMAYLVPAILSGHRVLVSTGTKNLQEQIYAKDVPVLRDALGIPFTATCMKGRANYLCLHRLAEYRSRQEVKGRRLAPDEAIFLPIIEQWVPRTETGDRAELAELPEDLALWHEVSATAETCLGTDCPRHSECFVTRMRQRAVESDVVIVNHHLLCADAAVRESAYGEVIPSCPHLVVDEAHQLEDVATQYFGVALSNHRVDDLVRDAEVCLRGFGRERAAHDAARGLMRVLDHSRAFFSALALARAGRSGVEDRLRLSAQWFADYLGTGLELGGALDGLEATFALAAAAPPETGPAAARPTEDAASIARRAGALARELRFLMAASDPGYVYFLEVKGRAVTLRAAPIDVSRIVRELVAGERRAAVLTSATLTVDGRFDYVRARLGLDDAAEIRVASEFDYASQTLLYLPRRMPLPRDERYAEAVAWETRQLLQCSRGRAFVLFTSYATMRAVVKLLELELDYPVLVQGTAPRSVLLEEFRRTPHAVLFATSSFWQGVDVQGEQLSAVIIDKLPFVSPGDPIVAARIEALTAEGTSAFEQYQVPLAILALLQGLGRLIRHRTDRGLLAVLDPRLRTMGYGRRFLDSLPPAPITHAVEDVRRFFECTG